VPTHAHHSHLPRRKQALALHATPRSLQYRPISAPLSPIPSPPHSTFSAHTHCDPCTSHSYPSPPHRPRRSQHVSPSPPQSHFTIYASPRPLSHLYHTLPSPPHHAHLDVPILPHTRFQSGWSCTICVLLFTCSCRCFLYCAVRHPLGVVLGRWFSPLSSLHFVACCAVRYSFGVVLWEMVARSKPWKDFTDPQVIWTVGELDERLVIPEGFPQCVLILTALPFGCVCVWFCMHSAFL
jgi:hypothetical protein